MVILIFDKLSPSLSEKLKSLAANIFVILDGVLSPAEETWLFSLIYTVEFDAVGALFDELTVIVSVPVSVAAPSERV